MNSTKSVAITGMSVRELIADLSETEDGLRRVRHAAHDRESSAHLPDAASLMRHQQTVVHELRRRARVRRIEASRDRSRRG